MLLLNQFHDIIPGSSIHWANEDCLRDHARIAELTAESIDDRGAGDRRAVAPSRSAERRRVQRGVARPLASSWRSRPTTGPSWSRRGARVRLRDVDVERRPASRSCRAPVSVSERVARERAAARHLGRRRSAHVDLRQGARPRGARARSARQRVPTARRQSARVRRVERRHRLPRSPRRPHRHLVDRGGRAGPAAGRRALRARASDRRRSRRRCGSRAGRGGSSS